MRMAEMCFRQMLFSEAAWLRRIFAKCFFLLKAAELKKERGTVDLGSKTTDSEKGFINA